MVGSGDSGEVKREYLTLILGVLMEQYVYDPDPEIRAEIERIKEELAELGKH